MATSLMRSQLIGAGSVMALCTLSGLPQTVFLTRYRKALASYKQGKEEPISKNIQNIIDKVLYLINISEEDEAHCEFFMCYGADSICRGSTKCHTGAIIGIPSNYTATTTDEVDKESLKIGHQTVNWETESGQKVIDSLVLSEKAKAFGIAREVGYGRTYHLYVETALKASLSCLAYTTGYMINNAFGLRERITRVPRVGMYGLIGVFCTLVYLSLSDMYHCFRDNRIDKKIALISRELAEGGVEYYSKILQRNQGLRSLLGSHGESLYTKFGNEHTTFRQSHVKLTTRRDNVADIMKGYHTSEQDSDVPRKTYFQ